MWPVTFLSYFPLTDAHDARVAHLLASTVNPTSALRSGLFRHKLHLFLNPEIFDRIPSVLFAPLTQYFVPNQTGAFMFPLNRPRPSTPQSLTPKMMQLRFGANSPRPSPFYSPSANPVQHLRCVVSPRACQKCLLCGLKYLSAKSEDWVYLWLGRVHPSWVYKTVCLSSIHEFQSKYCLLVPHGDKHSSVFITRVAS